MEPNELIVCRDASLGYEGQSVLAHLDLTIRAGDYLCIVGAPLPPVRGDSPGAGTAAGSRGLSAPADPGPAGLPGHGV